MCIKYTCSPDPVLSVHTSGPAWPSAINLLILDPLWVPGCLQVKWKLNSKNSFILLAYFPIED